jgi:hypothetical protein
LSDTIDKWSKIYIETQCLATEIKASRTGNYLSMQVDSTLYTKH